MVENGDETAMGEEQEEDGRRTEEGEASE